VSAHFDTEIKLFLYDLPYIISFGKSQDWPVFWVQEPRDFKCNGHANKFNSWIAMLVLVYASRSVSYTRGFWVSGLSRRLCSSRKQRFENWIHFLLQVHRWEVTYSGLLESKWLKSAISGVDASPPFHLRAETDPVSKMLCWFRIVGDGSRPGTQ
jgi:hypothetical protein